MFVHNFCVFPTQCQVDTRTVYDCDAPLTLIQICELYRGDKQKSYPDNLAFFLSPFMNSLKKISTFFQNSLFLHNSVQLSQTSKLRVD